MAASSRSEISAPQISVAHLTLAYAVVAGATLTVYENGAHGLTDTERDRSHAEMLAFIDS